MKYIDTITAKNILFFMKDADANDFKVACDRINAAAIDMDIIKRSCWEKDPQGDFYCKACGENGDKKWNYCPHCGATMNEEVDND